MIRIFKYKIIQSLFAITTLFLLFLGVIKMVTLFNSSNYTANASQNQFIVAKNGSDTNIGSLELPFQTIQKCAEIAQTGDTCLIREGVYRETVRPTNSGVTFKNYNNEEVTISGTEIIPNNSFVQHSGNIYKAPMNWSMNVRTWEQTTNNQIFVDGKMMVEARWPNIPVENVTRITNQAGVREDDARAEGATNLQEYSATYLDSQLSQIPAGLFNGAKINYGVGTNMIHTTCDVATQTQAQIDFACNDDNGNRTRLGTERTDDNDFSFYYSPRKGNYYYLWGKLEGLDNPGEWFWKDNELYLMMPDGSNPSQSTKPIEARRRAYAFDIKNRNNITIDGINLFAASIDARENANNNLIQNIEVRYLWHYQNIRPRWYNWQGTRGFVIRGNGNIVRDSYFAYSAGSMISINDNTNSNQIINNVIHDAGYMGSDVAITGKNNGVDNKHLIKNNTVFNTGRFVVDAGVGDIKYNDFYQSHLQINDLGTIYEWGIDGNNNEIAYNFVHSNYAELNNPDKYFGGFGIYLDDDTYNYKVYRNIIWNNTHHGIFAYGTNGTVLTQFGQNDSSNRIFYNNSVSGTIAADAKSDYNGIPQTVNGTIFKNNLADNINISTSEGATSENNFAPGGYIDPENLNFQLKNYSLGLNSAQNLGAPYMDSPSEPVEQPDSGALETGRVPFVAGAIILTQDLANLNANCNNLSTGASCTITNIPFGRKLGSDFNIKIGTAAPSGCTNQTGYQTHQTTGVCTGIQTPTNFTDSQDVFVKNATSNWIKIGTILPNSSNILSVTPNQGTVAGGTNIQIATQNIPNKTTYSKNININNANSELRDYQVLIEVDTQLLISQGKARTDCGDIRFKDQYNDFDYWLEEGCNTANTRFWVKVPYLTTGQNQIQMTYGDQTKTSSSDPKKIFIFFDDFSRTELGGNYWIPANPSITNRIIDIQDNQLRITGSTTDATKYNTIFFNLQNITFPGQFAIDSEMSVLSGSNKFKATAGGDSLTVIGLPEQNSTGKNLSFWNGSSWAKLGESKINSGQFNNKKLSAVFLGDSASRTINWSEDGNFDVLASRTGLSNPNIGGFYYGPDEVFSNFDVRFDNIRVRKAVANQPIAIVDSQENTLTTIVKIDNEVCLSLSIIDTNNLSCTTQPKTQGQYPVYLTDYLGNQYVYYNYEYIDTNIPVDPEPTNTPPTITTFSKTINENTTLSFTSTDFNSNYSDVDTTDPDTLTNVRIDTLPTNGTLKLIGVDVTAGQTISLADLTNLTYTPNTDYFGSDTFSWNATDGTDYTTVGANVNITVNEVSGGGGNGGGFNTNNPPVANSDNLETTINTLINYDIVSNDTDTEDQNSSLQVCPDSLSTTEGTISLQIDQRTISFRPANNFVGQTSFTYKVCDTDNNQSQPTTSYINISDNRDIIIEILTNKEDSEIFEGDTINFEVKITNPNSQPEDVVTTVTLDQSKLKIVEGSLRSGSLQDFAQNSLFSINTFAADSTDLEIIDNNKIKINHTQLQPNESQSVIFQATAVDSGGTQLSIESSLAQTTITKNLNYDLQIKTKAIVSPNPISNIANLVRTGGVRNFLIVIFAIFILIGTIIWIFNFTKKQKISIK